MKLKLLQGLSKDDEVEFREDFIKAQGYRKRLKEVLEGELASLANVMRNDEAFTNPNWPYFQAKKLGEESAILKVLTYLENESK